MDKATLTTQLQESVITLQFIKKDGTTRTMTCTQNRDFLNENSEKLSYVEPVNPARSVADNYCIVWDIENEGWRTVNVDSTEILKTVTCADYASNLK